MADPSRLPSGQLLIGAQPGAAELSFDDLDHEVAALLRSVRPVVVSP